MNWKNKKRFNYAEEKMHSRIMSPTLLASDKCSLDKKEKQKFQCLYTPDYTDIELKGLRVKVCNQNILINAEEKWIIWSQGSVCPVTIFFLVKDQNRKWIKIIQILYS